MWSRLANWTLDSAQCVAEHELLNYALSQLPETIDVAFWGNHMCAIFFLYQILVLEINCVVFSDEVSSRQ